jgi:SAM-dependent methyltransferase
MDPRREVEFFDQFAAIHGEYDVLGEGAYRRLIALFDRWVQPRAGERCVDLGCGTGAFTAWLRSFDLALTGMDISPLSIATANRNSQGEHYVVGDITSTGFPDASQDIIVYSGVLHHFPSRADRVRVLNEGFRILAPGGRLFAYDPNAQSPSMWLYRDPRSPLFSDKGKTQNEVLLRRDELTAELRAAGFDRVMIRGIGGITFRFIMGPAARYLLKIYNLYEHALRHSRFEDRLGTFLVSVSKKRA